MAALKLLYAALVLKIAIVIAEMFGAAQSGSLAMLTDAVHLSIDVLAIGTAIYAARCAARPGNTYPPGKSPTEIAAVRINGVVLLVLGLEIIGEGIERLGEPTELAAMGMAIGIAVFRLVCSLVTANMLARKAQDNMNLKAVHMHATADVISSASLIASALLVSMTGAAQFDTILSLVVAAVILRNGWRLLSAAHDAARTICSACDSHVAASPSNA